MDESESSSLYASAESEPSDTTPAESMAGDPPPSAIEKAIHSKRAVLLLCFGVLGFLGVPLICISRAFSRQEKFWWSAIVVLYTLLLFATAGASIWLVWRQWQEILS